MAPVNVGNDILVPLLDVDTAGDKLIHIAWSQDLVNRKADYYLVTANNLTDGTQFPFFVAAEWYKDSPRSDPKHITRIGELIPGEGYRLKVTDAFQYGQKNADGELRFVVYHDQERKPHQHRFVETAVGLVALHQVQEIVRFIGMGGIGDMVGDMAKNFVGEYLHTF